MGAIQPKPDLKQFGQPLRYEIWHDNNWPSSRQPGAEPSRFPEDFTPVAIVQANGLQEAVDLTTDKGGLVGDSRPYERWERNEGVLALAQSPRDTVPGDAIVSPQGDVYRVEVNRFEMIHNPHDHREHPGVVSYDPEAHGRSSGNERNRSRGR